jgi:fructose-bisphosphate aldolase, class I
VRRRLQDTRGRLIGAAFTPYLDGGAGAPRPLERADANRLGGAEERRGGGEEERILDEKLSACVATAAALTAPGKGLLAADESLGSIEKRFAPFGISSTEETRRAYRDLLVSTRDMQHSISGVIMFEETLAQRTSHGETFPVFLGRIGVIPGVKVDRGLMSLRPDTRETITEGLDGLAKRLSEYRERGARFAKWRAVVRIEGERLPTRYALEANAFVLARYASICQQAGIMPIVEPEVLRDGNHDIGRSAQVTRAVLEAVFAALYQAGVLLEGILLKPNMVTQGASATGREGAQAIAAATLDCLRRAVPAAVPGVVFLSGGQTPDEATVHLDEIIRHDGTLPWSVSFSYGRALQQEALAAWRGDVANSAQAQAAFLRRFSLVAAAARGELATAKFERISRAKIVDGDGT